MDINEFSSDFMDSVNFIVENEGKEFEEELTNSILEYLMDAGDVGAPEYFFYKKTGAAIHAYDYNIESNSLDLFILIPTDKALGKVNNGKVDDGFNRLSSIYRECMDGSILKNAKDNDQLHELVELIQSTKGQVDTLRLFVLTNGLVDIDYSPSTVAMENGLIIEQNIWDMARVYQQERIRSGREKIEIDFDAVYNTELQCLKMLSSGPDVQGYMAIIPGIVLAKIYNQYRHALLEKNVRNFLQFRGKVNKGIRSTLLKEPNMFFSYNNGISTTASHVETKEVNGSLFITRISDWQIVNGGQTTASIAATYKEKGTDLTEVFVPMKISVISNSEKSEEFVPKISTYSNSQTSIKKADFDSNAPFLIDLQVKSRETWVPNGNSKSICKWYFERTRGQYMDELAAKDGVQKRNFLIEYPKHQKFTKEDVFKVIVDWNQQPDLSCMGPGKCFDSFMKEISKNPPVVSTVYYRRLVAKAILYEEVKKLVKKSDLGGYKSNLGHYMMSALSFLSKKKLNLDKIWEDQKVTPELLAIMSEVMMVCWNHITNPIGTTNINDWTRKSECWETFRSKLDAVEEIPEEMRFSSDMDADESINPAQRAKIDEAWAYESDFWFILAKWAKTANVLTPRERKMAYQFGVLKSQNRIFSYKQASAGLRMIADSKEEGFDYEK